MKLDSEKNEPDIDEFVVDEYEPEPYFEGYEETYDGNETEA